MSPKTLGLVLIVAGIVVALLFGFADVIGIGDQNRFGSQQVAGTVIGALVFIVGLVIYLRKRPA